MGSLKIGEKEREALNHNCPELRVHRNTHETLWNPTDLAHVAF
jgi:hypothetical protein